MREKVVSSIGDLTRADYQCLGEFRRRIRRFLHFSEEVARAEGLEPQQHQLMLAVRSLDGGEGPTVGELAEHLLLRHHSAVGLIDRLAERGFVERARGADDRRQVRIQLTPKGEQKLKRLSEAHRAELRESGPELVEALRGLLGQLGVGER
ncbi:MAG: MarR family transcriptional regulator [Acidobacteriia bacterium]|nr:MarR family transcriptional regulator [Terriglobia bacterium]